MYVLLGKSTTRNYGYIWISGASIFQLDEGENILKEYHFRTTTYFYIDIWGQ